MSISEYLESPEDNIAQFQIIQRHSVLNHPVVTARLASGARRFVGQHHLLYLATAWFDTVYMHHISHSSNSPDIQRGNLLGLLRLLPPLKYIADTRL